MLHICLRYALDMPEMCLRYDWHIPEIYFFYMSGYSLTLYRSGYLTNWKGQGADLPPLLYGHQRIFLLVILDIYLEWVVKVKNPKAQVSTWKTVILRIFWKIGNFGENPKKKKICYLEIRFFVKKRSTIIEPRHIGRSVFFAKGP